MAKSTICEAVFSDAPKVDREQCVIRGVKLLGRMSKNGRTYSDNALSQAAKLYDGADVCIDHPRDSDTPRGMAESFALIQSPAIKADGVYGDLHYLKSHPLAESILERAERFPRSFGLSQNAVGSIVSTADGSDLVESIEHVESVDIVRRPATTAGLFESADHPTQKPMKKTLKKLLTESKAKDAPRLSKLLEEDGFAPMAEVQVDAPAGGDAVKDGIKAMVNAVIDDESLDSAAKAQKIKLILGVEDKLAEKAAETPTPGESSEPVAEQLSKRLARFERKEQVRDLLEEDGRTLASLTAGQRKLLEEAKDEDAMKALLETWPRETVTVRNGAKPPIGRAHETTIQESEDSLLAKTAWGRKKARQAV